jgi:membrane associated rhomboid family serine protease
MNKTKAAATILGVSSGLMGSSHGPGEILQGNVVPKGIMIMAWPQLTSSPLAGEPAVTVIPSFMVAGILTIVIAVLVMLWAGTCLERKQGGLLLILLSLGMLAVGGGVVPPLFGIAAGAIGAIMNCNAGKAESSAFR